MKLSAMMWVPFLALGQNVTYEPTLGVAEQQYREAQAAWLREDPRLAADLLIGNPVEMHRRVRHIADMRDEVMDKKARYLDLVVNRFATLRGRLEGQGQTQLPVAELKNELQQEQSRLLADQERLETLIADLPQGDEYALVMRELNGEKDELVKLQNAVAMRMRSLDQIGANQTTAREVEAKDPLAKKLDAITALWTEERDRTKAQRAKWAALYAAMDSEIDRGKAASQPVRKQGAPPAKQDKGKSPRLGELVPRGLEGSWLYRSGRGGWIGFGEPLQAPLLMRHSGIRVEEEDKARLPGRNAGDARDIRDPDLELSGQETSSGIAQVDWVSGMPPSQGATRLQLGGDRRVLVERLTANDSYFPRGMEVLLAMPIPAGR